MQFTVPQFIEHEARIMGPFTFKQFIYVVSGAAICIFIYFTAPFFLFVVCSLIVGGVALSLAIIKIGGRSLGTVFTNLLKFNLEAKTYVWQNNGNPLDVFENTGFNTGEIKENHPERVKTTQESNIGRLLSSH